VELGEAEHEEEREVGDEDDGGRGNRVAARHALADME
jgi:hypothetical protein